MKTYLIPVNEYWLSGIRKHANDLREAQDLLKGSVTPLSKGIQIYQAIGLGAGELEMILWAVENNHVEVVESE